MHPFRSILAVLLSAVIALQTLAAVAAPCSPALEGGSSTATTLGDSSHHAHHGATDSDAASDITGSDCCDAGYCSQGGCLSLAAATGDLMIPTGELANGPTVALPANAPLRSPNTLFRPPSD